MKKMVCVLTFLFSFIMCGVACYGAEIEKDIPVNAKTEVIMEGVKEGVRVKDNEIKVEMDDGRKEDSLDENSNNKQEEEADINKQEDENGNSDKKVDGKQNTSSSKTSKSEIKGIDIAYLLLILGEFVGTVILFIIILFKKKKDEEDSKSIE